MSLKTIHIVFIAVSVLLSVFFGVWMMVGYDGAGDATSIVVAILAFVSALLLIRYGVRFLRKLRHVSFL